MKSILFVITAGLLFLLALPAAGHAQAALPVHALPALPQGAEPRVGRYVELIVDDTGDGLAAGHFDFPFNPSVPTVVLFPEDIEHGRGFPGPELQLDIRGRTAALFTTRRRLKKDLQRNLTLFSENISVGMMVTAVDDPDDAIALAVVRRRSQVERWQAQYADYAATQDEQRERDAQRHADREMLAKFLHTASIVRPSTVEGDVTPYQAGASDITIHDFEGAWIGPNDLYLRFTLENNGDKAFAWAEAQALGPDRVENRAGVAEVLTPATPAEGLIGQVPARGRVRAGIHVERAQDLTGPLTIVLSEAGGSRPVMATLRNWIPLAFQPEHDVRMWEFRPVEPPVPPDPEKDKVSLHLQGVYGAVWLGDGTGLEKSDATRLTGLGVRAQYAFNRYIAVEGEAMGASTGEARFEGIEYEGMQGDLARSATLGRVQFGGVLRLGEQIVPLLRLGVGLQGASHRGTLTTATGEVPGPDAGFSFDGLWSIGTGLDLRLGQQFVAGIGLSAVFVAKNLAAEGVSGSIEAGIHLGYAWKP